MVLRKHLTKQQKAKVENNAREMSSLLRGIASVNHSREDRTPITDIFTGAKLSGLEKIEKPYTRMYVLQVCRFIATVIVEISNRAQKKLMLTAPDGSNESRMHSLYARYVQDLLLW